MEFHGPPLHLNVCKFHANSIFCLPCASKVPDAALETFTCVKWWEKMLGAHYIESKAWMQSVALTYRKAERIGNTSLVLCRSRSQNAVQRVFDILPWPWMQAPLLKPGIGSWWLFSFQTHCTELLSFFLWSELRSWLRRKACYPLAFPMFPQPTWWLALFLLAQTPFF